MQWYSKTKRSDSLLSGNGYEKWENIYLFAYKKNLKVDGSLMCEETLAFIYIGSYELPKILPECVRW